MDASILAAAITDRCSRFNTFMKEAKRKVCVYCLECTQRIQLRRMPSIPDGTPTKEDLLLFKNELLRVRRKAIAFGLKTTDVKEVYAKSWLRLARRPIMDAERKKKLAPFYRYTQQRFLANCFFLAIAALISQQLSRLTSSRCLISNNYFVKEITRPLTRCAMCENVSKVIVLSNPSREEFAQYAYSGKPILVKGATSNWTALHTFSFKFFKQIYDDAKDGYKAIEEECQFFPFRTHFIRLRELFAMPEEKVNLTNGKSAKPWYIGWSNCNPEIAEKLRSHYRRPAFLPEDSQSSAIDWIFMGYAGQGSSLHLDYVHRPSWQAQISGSKTWHLVPPPECELLCNSFEITVDEGDITAKGYYNSGANHEETLRENVIAYSKLKICPRFLRKSVVNRIMETTLLGYRVSMPICVSPTAMQRMAHPDGEIATVKACERSNTIMILSTISTSSIEEVASAAPEAIKWFQLYIYKDRNITKNLIRRAEKSGFKAIVLTVDAPFFGTRFADVYNNFSLPPNLRMANFTKGNRESDAMSQSNEGSSLTKYVSSLFDASLTWEDVKWLKMFTKLPVVVKGVLTPEDALMAIDVGASAVIVSNHGARQLDSVPATITVLPEIVAAVKNKCEVYLDGGIRCGTDIFKAIALGARAVFIGRPVLWGLCYNGEEGVKQILDILKNEFDIAMGLSGCSRLEDIEPKLVRHENTFCAKL
ncbi:hypothetical protein B4U79_14421 [Dinothrombium tinctorium]|uniref:(S)-2-hydroxy-acid oxidase n=1 Tax=Dinothrombium tinctorium TaxID=1965070 RepID=A0A443RGV8_9ACAR|nr:hypothetical protein B4U79_14421 [Dinothrombium tinctorium]